MLGDNNEHVITYWVLWERFHSPTLVGFEVISHWLPYLVLSVPFGALAERCDCRRLVQAAQALFMLVSLSWGVLFLTGTLQIWEACVLLVLHGCAGALWSPAEQLLLHDFARPAELHSMVRLNATFRNLGALCGPVVGTVLLFALGPVPGILTNILFYVPMTAQMLRTPHTGHGSGAVVARRAGLKDTVLVLRDAGRDRVLVSMIALSALAALCLGGTLQVAMPSIAVQLGAGSGAGYGALLLANGIGAVCGGLLLEATGRSRPSVLAAVVTAALFGATTLAVATSGLFALAVIALAVGGFANLASMSIAQSIVQLRAPADRRGRVVGVFNTFSAGFRTGNGVLLAGLGSAIGITPAVAVGGGALIIGATVLGVYARSTEGSNRLETTSEVV